MSDGEGAPRAVYDDRCGLCRRVVRWLSSRERSRVPFVPFASLSDADAARVLDAGFRNEMVLLRGDRATSGAAAVLEAMETGRLRTLAKALRSRPLFPLVSAFYRLVARNRRVLAPAPPDAIACNCEPEPDAPAQLAFTLLSVVGAAALLVLAARLSSDPRGVGFDLLRCLVLGLAVAASTAIARVPAGSRLAYLAAAAWSLLAAAPLALPAAFTASRVDAARAAVTWAALTGVAVVVTRRMMHRRVASMRLGMAYSLPVPLGVLMGAALA